MKALLALDLGTNTGYAYRSAGGDIVFGTWCLATDREMRAYKKAKHDFRGCDPRVCKLADHVHGLVTGLGVSVLGWEDVMFSSSTAQTQLWASFRSVLWSLLCQRTGIEAVPLPVGTLKKFATGSGNATKEQMALALSLKFPDLDMSAYDDNAVDARHLLEYLIQKHP